MSETAKAPSEARSLRFFLLSASLVAALCISGGFLGMALRDRKLIEEEMVNRARRDFANIVMMRQWNARYGGVYVEKRPGVVSNPYLENPDITASDGKVYTKKNPALMTRELSELLHTVQGYAFHITSLRPLNPGNIADPREAEALKAFEAGAAERSWTEGEGRAAVFRYMAPLETDASCLQCHAQQGYRLGDVRGGISVSFQVGELKEKLRRNLLVIGGLGTATFILLVVSIVLLFRQMVRRLQEARAELMRLATTDALTGLANRRTILERLEEEVERHRRTDRPLACILLDIDHFKRINDRFGHPAGDEVLRQVARQLQTGVRVYDTAGRYGGEEFLAVLPEADPEAGRLVAERLRALVAGEVRCGDGEAVTASFGLAQYRKDESADALLARADQALYRAKEAGRNRVESEA